MDFKRHVQLLLSMLLRLWTSCFSLWVPKRKIPQPPESILRVFFKADRLEILEFLSEVYVDYGFFQYETKIYIIDPKLSMKAINKLDKGSHDYLTNSPLNNSFLGTADRSPEIRHIIASIFRKSNVELKGQVMAKIIDKTVMKMKDCEECNVTDTLLKMALDIVGQVLLGCDLGALDGQQGQLLDAMMTILHRTYALGKISPNSQEFRDATDTLDKLTMEILSQSLQETDDHSSSSLVHQLYKAGGVEVAKSNLQLFIMAGSETTASSLPLMLDLLARNPELQSELQLEADEWIDRLRENVSNVPPKLESATKELLRQYAIAPFVSRKTDTDIDLGSVMIPAGSDLRIFMWGIHRSSRLWKDSKQYHFDRFREAPRQTHASNVGSNSNPNANAWMPFGAGPRVCIGQHLAWFEMRMALTFILHHFTFRPTAQTKDVSFCVDWEHAVVHPVSDVILKVEPRNMTW